MQQLNCLKQKMALIVQKCLEIYNGGESYFTELDKMVKDNAELLVGYLLYISAKEKVKDIVISGEIGTRMLDLQNKNQITSDINLMIVNGGLRKNAYIHEQKNVPDSLCGRTVIFFDDSYYSGKTADSVKRFVESRGGTVIRTYVFYDGCKESKNDVFSLYRYY